MEQDWRESFYNACIRNRKPPFSGLDALSVEAMLSLVFTNDVVASRMNKYLAKYGLSRSTFNILAILRHGKPEGMQLHDLGRLLLVTRANVTGLIDHLEEKGYVKRIVDSQDRRARYARLTRKGEALLETVLPDHQVQVEQLMTGFSTEEKHSMVRLMERIRQNAAIMAEKDTVAPAIAVGAISGEALCEEMED